jgi:hypothetical protein
MLTPGHPFCYETVMLNPKQVHPDISNGGQEYSLLHNNGFMRIHTIPGRIYHYLQAKYFYQLPDWKLHFSIQPEDLPKAWNIIAELFLEKKCLTTMKMIVADYGEEVWPEHMHGREITVYIYQHKKYYEDVGFPFGPTIQTQQTKEFWLDFMITAEARLAEQNIKERPHPEGDKSMGRYCSLRNESFIPLKEEWKQTVPANRRVPFNRGEYCYPPNEAGWNGAGHKNPLDKKLYAFFAQSYSKKVLRNEIKPLLSTMQEDMKNGNFI